MLYGDKANLIPAGTDLVKRVLARDFTSVETRDRAGTVFTSANAYTADDDVPGPFGADAPLRSENEAVALAEELDADPASFGAPGDGAEKIDPEKLKKFAALARFILGLLIGL